MVIISLSRQPAENSQFTEQAMKKSFWERRRFFEVYSTGLNAQAGGDQSNEVTYACTCCGYPTLRALGEFDICFLCCWEDDGQDDADADLVRRGPNRSFSLVEARENVAFFCAERRRDRRRRMCGRRSHQHALSNHTSGRRQGLYDAFGRLVRCPPPFHPQLSSRS